MAFKGVVGSGRWLLAVGGAVLLVVSAARADALKLAGSCLVLDYDTNFPAGRQPQTRYEWSGACRGGYASGPGVLKAYWDEQLDEMTVGTLVQGRLEGHAVTTNPAGYRFEGRYEAGRRRGYGVYTGVNGRGLHFRYVGNFEAGAPQGHGSEVLSNGERYEGDFVGGLRAGHGVQTGISPQGLAYRYEGDFDQGGWSGHGVLTWANGDRYDGIFRQGNRNGPGVFSHVDGERLLAEFRDGEPSRHGPMILVQQGALLGAGAANAD